MFARRIRWCKRKPCAWCIFHKIILKFIISKWSTWQYYIKIINNIFLLAYYCVCLFEMCQLAPHHPVPLKLKLAPVLLSNLCTQSIIIMSTLCDYSNPSIYFWPHDNWWCVLLVSIWHHAIVCFQSRHDPFLLLLLLVLGPVHIRVVKIVYFCWVGARGFQ